MKKVVLAVLIASISLTACEYRETEQAKEAEKVNKQQSQYAKGQPVPSFDWSFERHLMTELYKARNRKVNTHSVWRSNTGYIEGDCPSLGFGLPYDVSLTNPLAPSKTWWSAGLGSTVDVVEQPEPNGVFASKNTSATWVMCLNEVGSIDPVYIEAKVTVYPYSVDVDYDKDRVRKVGESYLSIPKE